MVAIERCHFGDEQKVRKWSTGAPDRGTLTVCVSICVFVVGVKLLCGVPGVPTSTSVREFHSFQIC